MSDCRDRVLKAQARAMHLLDELEAEARSSQDVQALQYLTTVRQLITDAYTATLTRRTRAA